MKNQNTLIALFFILLLASCGKKNKSTKTLSSEFLTLAEKQDFLEDYVTYRRSYQELHFNLSYLDGGSGLVPGPTEWNVRLFATVPAEQLDKWTNGLSQTSTPELDWISDIPQAPKDVSSYQWHQDNGVTVGIHKEENKVLYWNLSL